MVTKEERRRELMGMRNGVGEGEEGRRKEGGERK